MNWERYGYVVASNYRKKIILLLAKGEKTPAQLAAEAGMYISHVCATLSDLTGKGLVKCLTPELRRGKIYSLTSEGKEVYEKLKHLQR
jgi:predicted transcriptional regulator